MPELSAVSWIITRCAIGISVLQESDGISYYGCDKHSLKRAVWCRRNLLIFQTQEIPIARVSLAARLEGGSEIAERLEHWLLKIKMSFVSHSATRMPCELRP